MNEVGSEIGSVDLGSDSSTIDSTRIGLAEDWFGDVRTDLRTSRDDDMTSLDANLRCNPKHLNMHF